jgi:hypothetical protein
MRIGPPEANDRPGERFLLIDAQQDNALRTDTEKVAVGDALQLVYVFACDGGMKAAEWEGRCSPAQVITYDRVSTLWDHAQWFALIGPTQIDAL